MDQVHPEGDRREDLRVTIPDDPAWIAIVEVRGYRGGAQVKDLMRLARFRSRFRTETGAEPDASWYVVNQFLGVDPGGRQRVLSGNPDEVSEFAADDGLVIDTRELFRLVNAVNAGALALGDARDILRSGRGVFKQSAT
jgi:hypothetical protein